jgi:hypothetical protein
VLAKGRIRKKAAEIVIYEFRSRQHVSHVTLETPEEPGNGWPIVKLDAERQGEKKTRSRPTG